MIDAHEVGTSSLPSFVKFNIWTFEFIYTPTQLDLQKKQNYNIQIDIKDSFGASTSQKFSVSLYSSSNTSNKIESQNKGHGSLNNLQNSSPASQSSENQINYSNIKSDVVNNSSLSQTSNSLSSLSSNQNYANIVI